MDTHRDAMVVTMGAIEAALSNYTQEFFHYQQLSRELDVDMFICDSFAIACIDAAQYMKKPVMITSTFDGYGDMEAPFINNRLYMGPNPTTANDGLFQRIYRDYIRAPLHLWAIRRRSPQAVKTQRDFGLSFASDCSSPRYNYLSKIVHNVFGIEVAKSLTPLDHHVGPIMSSSYPEIDSITRNFLDSHHRVVYVGFGQHARTTDQDVELILPNLLRLKQEGHIDGIIWARLDANITDKDILLPGWAPQFAILQHPSTCFFISHGGVGSLIESLYNGVRLFVYPFFGDQLPNARAIQQNGLGEYFDAYLDSPSVFYDRLLRLASDPDQKIQKAVGRFKAYVQISSMNSAAKAADLVEEGVFASDEEGELGYRRHVKHNISFMKRHNLDIVLVLSLPLVVFCVYFFTPRKLKKE
ncbi:hypothetical protein G6F56_010474 [Rhizopus delemar]|nr:hypothetical protein G6F56_010474 [Rhizopus delemar]